jgi:hypothetical protein
MPPVSEPVSALVQKFMALLNSAPGVVTPGNIDLAHRPHIPNPAGGFSSVYSMTFGLPGGRAVLVPGVIQAPNGQWTVAKTPHEAFAAYNRTGMHLGVFKSEAAANRFANLLHREQAAYYTPITIRP